MSNAKRYAKFLDVIDGATVTLLLDDGRELGPEIPVLVPLRGFQLRIQGTFQPHGEAVSPVAMRIDYKAGWTDTVQVALDNAAVPRKYVEVEAVLDGTHPEWSARAHG